MVEYYNTGSFEVINETLRGFLERNGFTRIPLSVNTLGHFEIDALINGVEGKFILDTGASGTVLNNADMSSFRLMMLTDEEDKAAGLGSTTMHVQKSKGNKIVIGGFEIHEWTVGIIDLGHVIEALAGKGADKVNGVIGADILKRFEAVIDYGENALYLKREIEQKSGIASDASRLRN